MMICNLILLEQAQSNDEVIGAPISGEETQKLIAENAKLKYRIDHMEKSLIKMHFEDKVIYYQDLQIQYLLQREMENVKR